MRPGTALVYSTFLEGSGLDACAGIAIDSGNNAYVAGTTYSVNFPMQAAAFSTLGGSASGFVTKISPAGSALIYSTYLGGTNFDQANAIAVDSPGSAYVAGSTASIDFPVTAGVPQSTLNGLYNAFVSKLSPAGTSLVYSTLLGGSNSDAATSIVVDSSGRAAIGGYTSSPNFPLVGALQSTFGGIVRCLREPAQSAGVESSFLQLLWRLRR
jgi:Beta-propeller repeat